MYSNSMKLVMKLVKCKRGWDKEPGDPKWGTSPQRDQYCHSTALCNLPLVRLVRWHVSIVLQDKARMYKSFVVGLQRPAFGP
jgi:hypothetical protein